MIGHSLKVALVLGLCAGVCYAGETKAKTNKREVSKGTVTRLAAIAKPANYTGKAPAKIQFVGTIFVKNPPVKVEYEWLRSDGATGERKTIEIRSAGEGVYDTWTLGEPKDQLHVWEKLHVISPVDKISGKAVSIIKCK